MKSSAIKLGLFLFLNLLCTFQIFGIDPPKFSYHKTFGNLDTNILGVTNQRFLNDGSFYFIGFDKTKYDKLYFDTTGGILYYYSKGKLSTVPKPISGFRTKNFDIDTGGNLYATQYKNIIKIDSIFGFASRDRYNKTSDSIFIYHPNGDSWEIKPVNYKYKGKDSIYLEYRKNSKYNKDTIIPKKYYSYANEIIINKQTNRIYTTLSICNFSDAYLTYILAELDTNGNWNGIDSNKIRLQNVFFKYSLLPNIYRKNIYWNYSIRSSINSYAFEINTYNPYRNKNSFEDTSKLNQFGSPSFLHEGILLQLIPNMPFYNKIGLDNDSNLTLFRDTLYLYGVEPNNIKMLKIHYHHNRNVYFIGKKSDKYYFGFYNTIVKKTQSIEITKYIKSKIGNKADLYISEMNVDKNGIIWLATNYGFFSLEVENNLLYFQINGKICYDLNNSNTCDSNDFYPLRDVVYQTDTSRLSTICISDSKGIFQLYTVDTGKITLKHVSNDSAFFKSVKINPNPIVLDSSSSTKSVDIVVSIDTTKKILSFENAEKSRFVINNNGIISLKIKSTYKKGYKIKISIPAILNYKTSSDPSNVTSDSVYLTHIPRVPAYNLFSNNNYTYSFRVPQNVKLINRKETFYIEVYPNSSDSSTVRVKDSLEVLIRGAYDPNDKAVTPIGESDSGNIPLYTDKFTYTVRFQNTGNYHATKVQVIDTLNKNLDFNTFRLINTSHRCDTKLDNKGRVEFNFYNINLPDSNTNEPKSHGYIQYSIKPKVGRNIQGNSIKNTAHIYFDFNPAIVTNTVKNTFKDNVITLIENNPKNGYHFNIYPNPSRDGKINVENMNLGYSLGFTYTVWSSNGQLIQSGKLSNQIQTLDLSQISKGNFILQIRDGNSKKAFVSRFIVE